MLSIARICEPTLPTESTTPFGSPVEPDVKITVSTSSDRIRSSPSSFSSKPTGVIVAWTKARTLSNVPSCFRRSPASRSFGPASSFTRLRKAGLEITCLSPARSMQRSRIACDVV